MKESKKPQINFSPIDEYEFVDSFGMKDEAYEEAWARQKKGYLTTVRRIPEISEWGLYIKKFEAEE